MSTCKTLCILESVSVLFNIITENLFSTCTSTRRRFIKEKKVPGNKIEKLLDVFPQVIFSSGTVVSINIRQYCRF